uniref:Uncharacterized protein n=1 Tax=Corethron hystrix TaxID=216773 RepID=A0A7S1BT22_9STRA|mmetsp:Transcript_40024/g.93961  ORF Transcript_40024/g.93961 Transcript_40024/m.93961 type:complete len:215 (+) Transcript_40024:251-895(+)
MSDVPPPTRMNQQVYKGKKKAAEAGFKLLKKKADALKARFQGYAKEIAETKASMATDASSAFFSLTQAEYAAGNFKQKVFEGQLTARVRVGAGVDNVAGVKLPVFTKYETGAVTENQSLGLVGGGKKISAVREKFTTLLDMLLKYEKLLRCSCFICLFHLILIHQYPFDRLASLQTSFATLDEALKGKNRLHRILNLSHLAFYQFHHPAFSDKS